MDAWIRSKVSAVLLAAGLSRRMGERDKLLLPCGGGTLLTRAVELMDSLPFFEKILVTTHPRLEHISLPPGIRSVINPNPRAGLSESLRLGLAEASGEYYLFMTADQPLLDAAELRRLLGAAMENPGRIVYPSVHGNPCNPTLFPARFRRELLAGSGDTGGRGVRTAHAGDCLALEPVNQDAFLDIDTPEDYAGLTKPR